MKKIFSLVPVMKKMAPVLVASVLLLPLTARAEIKAGSVEVSPFVGYNFFEKVQNLENRPIFGGRLGYNFTNTFGIEGSWEYIRSRVDDKNKTFSKEGQFTSPISNVDINMYHLDLVYHFLPEGKFNPFIVAGYGAVNYSPKINSKNMSVIDFGVGAKYWMTENIALRLDVRDNMIYDDQIHNIGTTLGVVFAFGGTSKTDSAPVAKTVEAAPVAAPVDSDGDGVYNTQDKCPGTPAGVSVGRDGCPLDSDKDGVADYLDKCPGTPAGVSVGMDGCPLDSDKDGVTDDLDKCPGTPVGISVDKNGCPLDDDKDGVADYLDKCPATPVGVKVDANGCPLDSDKDGVTDDLDKCPGTPVGVSVDKNGCPLDSDKDGVADYLDKCPATPVGKKVAANGCPEVIMSSANKAAAAKRYCSKPAVLGINFDTNMTDIKHHYYDELKTVGDFLTYFPNAKGEIAGHADTVGTREYNVKLSQARADSVRKYIVETFGTEADRIGTKGYGFSKPVASNKTEAGRAKNRRIEANFTCE